MVKVSNEKRLPVTMQNPWLEPFFTPWTELPWFRTGFMETDSMWDKLSENFERMYDFFPSYMRQIPKDISCDLVDRGDRYVLTTDLPGIQDEDVKVNVTGRQVEISAEHKDQSEERSKNYIRNERSLLRYRRVLSVPEKVAESDITAKMNNGTLTVELPKKSTIKKVHQIEK
ncbi:MAG: Hsp20/alpha crystallin family protein [Thaumarchaeota archaeon]|nr:Hsp20/alpha crystallin family protein [Nitrososphaerota archaeon]